MSYKDVLSDWLSEYLKSNEVSQYCDVDYAISTIKQGEPCWPAAASIAFRVASFHLDGEDTSETEKAFVQETAHSTIEPLENLIRAVENQSEEESPQEDREHTLFHMRFALGGLYLAKGDVERAVDILTEAISAENEYENDIAVGKTFASYIIVPQLTSREKYKEACYLLKEPFFALNWEHTLSLYSKVIDIWIEKCKKTKDLEQWLSLIDAVYQLVEPEPGSTEEEITEQDLDSLSSNSIPKSREEELFTSYNYWAWRYGRVVGYLWLNRDKGQDLINELMFDWFDPGNEDTVYGVVVLSLLTECDAERDWDLLRDEYLTMWKRTYNEILTAGWDVDESPNSGLYWAARVGVASVILEYESTTGAFEKVIEPKVLTEISEILERDSQAQRTFENVLKKVGESLERDTC